MNKILNITIIIMTIALMFSCGDNNTNASNETEASDGVEAAKAKAEALKNCTYSVNTVATVVQWTAYKTSEKFPVKGIFENVAIQSNPDVKSPIQLIEGTKFEISPTSVNSNDPVRDKKLVNSFFNKLVPDMYGEFKATEGDDSKGTGIIDMHWNGLRKSTAYDYTIIEDSILITTSFNITEWDAVDALESLNEVCKEKHTGKDGKAVTGNDIDVKITVVVMKKCI